MKINYLFKAAPFLSTLLLIIFLGFTNKKDYTKLRILIWNTPKLRLGTYLGISAGSGFILSYLITTNISKINKSMPKESLNYKDDIKYENNNINTKIKPTYDNTLIERDIKDPSPTINAKFRIIGKTEASNINFVNKKVTQFDDSLLGEEEYYEGSGKYETNSKSSSLSSDWYDQSFSDW